MRVKVHADMIGKPSTQALFSSGKKEYTLLVLSRIADFLV
jgi:hypothetical protein